MAFLPPLACMRRVSGTWEPCLPVSPTACLQPCFLCRTPTVCRTVPPIWNLKPCVSQFVSYLSPTWKLGTFSAAFSPTLSLTHSCLHFVCFLVSHLSAMVSLSIVSRVSIVPAFVSQLASQFCLPLCLPTCLPVYLPLRLSLCLPARLPICLPLRLSVSDFVSYFVPHFVSQLVSGFCVFYYSTVYPLLSCCWPPALSTTLSPSLCATLSPTLSPIMSPTLSLSLSCTLFLLFPLCLQFCPLLCLKLCLPPAASPTLSVILPPRSEFKCGPNMVATRGASHFGIWNPHCCWVAKTGLICGFNRCMCQNLRFTHLDRNMGSALETFS